MKKSSLILALFLGFFMHQATKAQEVKDYYPGKWLITIFGTPQGDAKLTFVLERKDNKLSGFIQDSLGKQLSPINQFDEKEKTLTMGFNLMNYDLTLTLDPVDDDHIKGSMMGMFDAKGIRIKETK
jgi:hypothetical protein